MTGGDQSPPGNQEHKWDLEKTSHSAANENRQRGIISVFIQKVSVSHQILCFTVGRIRAVKMDWAEPCGRDGIWLELSHCSRARLILGRNVYRKKMN